MEKCIRKYIIDESSLREKNMEDIRKRVAMTFENKRFKTNIERSGDRNWLQMDVGQAFKEILDFLLTINI